MNKLILIVFLLIPMGCILETSPNLGNIYNGLAQQEDPYRNPIVVIPGILGSKLVEEGTEATIWGTFGLGQVDPNSPEGARLVALPMAKGRKLHELKDNVKPNGALDSVVINVLGFPVQWNAYFNILSTLGVGGYRDQDIGESGRVDYGDRHFTCFQFDYDWRRDIVESAKTLDRFIKTKRAYVQQEIEKRFGVENYDVKFDLVAHSMGGLVARYYLRYGAADLPENGDLPELTWEGARYVNHLVMIGTPNAGSVDALKNLVHGIRPGFFLPHYSATLQGTMPSVYQLLPRSRHHPLLDPTGQPVNDILDPSLWEQWQWGLANPAEAEQLQHLLPAIDAPEQRRAIALDHQRKLLRRAKQFAAAMDRPATPPASLKLLLVAGDAEETDAVMQVDQEGELETVATAPGDGIVLRSSALLDERTTRKLETRLQSPIAWNQVLFLFEDHLGITEDPTFVDNLLYFLLESPREPQARMTM